MDKKCKIDGCGASMKYGSRGWCDKHYHRFLRHGDPNTLKRNPPGTGSIHRGYKSFNKNGKHIYEHTMVMEESLGRKLYPNESVHHKNGIRDDNRLENLELWITPQRPGQRVEDIVAWAKEIIKRYES